MWGAIAAGGAMAGGAIWQYVNNMKARKQQSAITDEMERILDKIQVPNLNADPLAPPDYDFSQLSPEEYKLIEQYVPEAAPNIIEQAPQLAQYSAAGKEGQDAQLSALRKFAGIGAQETDPELMNQLMKTQRQAQIGAQSRAQSAIQDAQRRGVFGSGISQSLGQQGALSEMENAALTSQDAASKAYANRLNALAQSGQLGGQIAQQDISLQGRNADIINAYNQRASNAQRNYVNQVTGDINYANRFNIGQAQDISNMNVDARNESARYNQQYLNKLKQDRANWLQSQRAYGNQAQTQDYQNQMSKFGAKYGIGQDRSAMIGQSAADKNAAIQGVTNAVTAGGMYAGQRSDRAASQQQWQQQQDAQNRREYYYRTGKLPEDDQEQYNSIYGG